MRVRPLAEPARIEHFFRRSCNLEFDASPLVQGAWSTTEQHVAPSLGLLTHVMEEEAARRHGGRFQLTRLCFDILGTFPIGPVTCTVSVVRPGRTIELLEGRLSCAGRLVIVSRAWFAQKYETMAIAGSTLSKIASADEMRLWNMSEHWPGACIAAMNVRRRSITEDRAWAWIDTAVELVAGEAIGATARAMTMVDLANGTALRLEPGTIAYPNLDLTAHMFRKPRNGMLGLDTTVSVGGSGVGMNNSTMHDADGPYGVVTQTLTIRPR
jgi:hypothetical protein